LIIQKQSEQVCGNTLCFTWHFVPQVQVSSIVDGTKQVRAQIGTLYHLFSFRILSTIPKRHLLAWIMFHTFHLSLSLSTQVAR
jgi:hypothetical protein